MNPELDVHGVFIPSFLVLMITAYALTQVARRFIGWTGFYDLVWHRALFNLALYVLILGAIHALSRSFA